MKPIRAILILMLLFAGAFTLAISLQPYATALGQNSSGNAMRLLFGESRSVFADYFAREADVYMHSGYYPSVFEQAQQSDERNHGGNPAHEDHDEDSDHGDEHHDAAYGFMGPPTDWLDRFGRHFRITEHTHLQGGNVREILPWLRMSADLNPQRAQTFLVGAYFLRKNLRKTDEAEQFLREGLRANPDNYEILFELGKIYFEDRHDPERAESLWELALRRWQQKEPNQEKPDYITLDDILIHLAQAEQSSGHDDRAIAWLEKAKEHSPNPDAVQKHIDELRAKLNSAPTNHVSAP